MNRHQRLFIAYLVTDLILLAILIWLTATTPPSASYLLPALLFGALIVFANTFGVRLPAGVVSLLPMTTVAAYLVTGPVPTGWAAFIGTILYGGIRARWGKQLGSPWSADPIESISLLAANVTLHTGSILAGGAVFELLGGTIPLKTAQNNILPLIALGIVYLIVNHLLASAVIIARGRKVLLGYFKALPNMLFFEGGPLIFAPLMALIYTQLGLAQFTFFALLIVVSSLITRGLSLTSNRLERRVKELDSLQAVGQALSASLNIDTILSAIHTQVAALMPAQNFYVALYDSATDEVSFPLAFEGDELVHWRSRRAGTGLTEHILQTRQPLLIRQDVGSTLDEIGIEQIGEAAASWLGVPILAEGEPIGVITVQSYDTPNAYDASHQEILVTIAAQAAVALQNARLYERTDEALARRVQELDSILRTTSEGVLLVDANWNVLAANRALADFAGIAQVEMLGQNLRPADPGPDEDSALLASLGYTEERLEHACQRVAQTDTPQQHTMAIPGTPERHVERTLTPVRDRTGSVSGWLFVLRDISEEIELAQLRDDMTHMLVHDLRSPLTVLKGSLEMMESAVNHSELEEVRFLTEMAQRGSNRMLRMVNELLDVSKLESGELPIHPKEVNVEPLLKEVANRLAPLASDANIAIDLSIAPHLPALYVDPQFIDRVLHNLLDNAIKFTRDGEHVQLWAKQEPENADSILLGVTDRGPGIPEEELHRLFEKFQQVSSVTGRRVGTGLGLPFCKLAVEAHGGQIWVESQVGEGSTFILRLPTAAA